jgi:polyketide biosynthesis enoyl-CoA hydratase PksH
MGILNGTYETIRVRLEEDICFLQIHRPESSNAINDRLIDEMGSASRPRRARGILVLEGLPDVFCSGADFKAIQMMFDDPGQGQEQDPERLYDL